jgi:hypothetical protein
MDRQGVVSAAGVANVVVAAAKDAGDLDEQVAAVCRTCGRGARG